MAGAATCVMVESSRSITAAAITTPKATHRPRRPARSAPASAAPVAWPLAPVVGLALVSIADDIGSSVA